MAGTFTNLHYHLVFSTKDRLPLINADFQSRLYEYIGGILRSEKSILLAAGGMPDHVHLLARCHQGISISDYLRIIKSKSTLWINDTIHPAARFAWQEGYGAFTVSKSDLPRVTQYIQGQEEHHRTQTFQDEFLRFLELHEIEYDERFIWK